MCIIQGQKAPCTDPGHGGESRGISYMCAREVGGRGCEKQVAGNALV